jgi:hypothetical protein
MAKKNGYDPTNPKNRPSIEEREIVSEWKRAQREPYDPAKEQVMEEVGSISADLKGHARIHVELVSYNGTGPLRVRLSKRGKNARGDLFSTPNLGMLYPNVVAELSAILDIALGKVERAKASEKSR